MLKRNMSDLVSIMIFVSLSFIQVVLNQKILGRVGTSFNEKLDSNLINRKTISMTTVISNCWMS